MARDLTFGLVRPELERRAVERQRMRRLAQVVARGRKKAGLRAACRLGTVARGQYLLPFALERCEKALVLAKPLQVFEPYIDRLFDQTVQMNGIVEDNCNEHYARGRNGQVQEVSHDYHADEQ